MFLPSEYLWIEPVLIAALIVFIVSWIGNSITFANKFINALITAIVFGLIFGAVAYTGYGDISMSVTTKPSPTAPAQRNRQN
jgi:uncharacterized membrane protein YadS